MFNNGRVEFLREEILRSRTRRGLGIFGYFELTDRNIHDIEKDHYRRFKKG